MEASPIKAPHFILTYVKPYLENKYGRDYLNRAGLKVYTTLDINYQEEAENILKEKLEELKIYNAYNGGLITINPQTGELLVMVGSKDWDGESEECSPETDRCKFDPKVNTALSLRQPGSAFKPFVYATAFEKGYTPATLLWDVSTEFNPNCSPLGNQSFDYYGTACYHPRNYNNTFTGLISLRNALAQSRNLPSVKLLYLAGIKDSLETANKMGISSLKEEGDYGLALVLGGGEVKLIDMAYSYGIFANDGLKTPQNFILKIEDNKGNIIEKIKEDKIRVLSSQTAQEINSILSDNQARSPMFGYNSLLYFENYQVAVKTGTTQFLNDAWTIGYTPSLVTAVWVGNNDNTSMTKPGVSLAGPIWHDFMGYLLEKNENNNFSPIEEENKNSILTGQDLNGHSILYYLNKKDPQGPAPEDPSQDPQYFNWEYGVKRYLGLN
jgi:membrane peptidoglycan carboxypeptidase